MNNPEIFKGIFCIKQDEYGRFIPLVVKAECDESGNVLDERLRECGLPIEIYRKSKS